MRILIAEDEEKGFADRFRYARTEENGRIRLVFLDMERELDSFTTF